MRRPPSLRLHKPSGRAVVTIKGRDYYCGPFYTPDGRPNPAAKRAYRRILNEYLGSNGSPAFGKTDLSVVEVLAAFVKEAKNRYGTETNSELHRFRTAIKTLRRLYGELPAADFGPKHLRAFRHRLLYRTKKVRKGPDGKPTELPLSRKYINRQVRRVVFIWKWAASEELVKPSCYRKLQLIEPLRAGRSTAVERPPVAPIDDKTIAATLPHLSNVVRGLVEFQRLTGCRPGEACSITPAMIDRSGDVWIVTLKQHKTAHRGKNRVIYCGPKAQQILRPLLDRDPDACCFSPADAVKELLHRRGDSRVTPFHHGNSVGSNRVKKPRRQPGKRYKSSSYATAIRRACEKAGVPPWTPNQLRHSAATEIRRIYGLEAASVTLGHSNLSITQLYAEQDREKAILVAKQLG